MTTALVPLRDPGHGKTRLRAVLSSEHRAELASAMLADVVTALHAAALPRIVVVAGGPAARDAARALDVEVLRDPPSAGGLNAALAAAAARVGSVDELLVVAADLPRLAGDDVATVLHSDAEVVVAPTRGGGTGGLLRRPGNRIVTAYGASSAQRHLDLATRAGASSATVRTHGFTEDVDTEEDLARLGLREGGPGGTGLGAIGLGERGQSGVGPATARWLDEWVDRHGVLRVTR